VSIGAWAMLLIVVLAFGALGFVIVSMIRTMKNERARGRSVWKEFGLGLSLLFLFLATWIAQGFAEWQTFTDEQRAHGETPTVGDFAGEFAQSTLENWQSEFLQLFAFVSLAALYIHKGSAESRDGDEKLEAALRRIEDRLGTLPSEAPSGDESWRLPDAPPYRSPANAAGRENLIASP
jgi:Domain of unknown function (DUF6766)